RLPGPPREPRAGPRDSRLPSRGGGPGGAAAADPRAGRPGHRRAVRPRDRAQHSRRGGGGSLRPWRREDAGETRSRRMRGIRVTPAGLSPQAIAGRVLAHDVFGEEGEVVVPKGKVLSELDVEPHRALSWTELHLVETPPRVPHDESAPARISK